MNRKSVVLSLTVPLFVAWATSAVAQDRFVFTQAAVSDLPTGDWTFSAIDYPGDGAIDLFGTRAADNPRLVLGTNTGGAFEFETWPAGPLNASTRLQTADLTADGLADLFVYDASTGETKVGTRSGGSYSFSTWSTVFPAAGWSFAIGDFSGDGLADLLGYYEPNGSLHFGINAGSSFVWSNAGGVAPATGWIFAAGHFTNAATAQVSAYHPSNDSLWVLTYASGAFSGSLWGDTTAGGWHVDQLLADDFNRDGRSDVLGYDEASGELIVGLSNGTNFQVARWGAVPAAGTWSFVTGAFTALAQPDVVGFEADTQTLWLGDNVQRQCDNDFDDDGDGLVDFPADARCMSLADNDEKYNPACGLGGEVVVAGALLLRLCRRH